MAIPVLEAKSEKRSYFTEEHQMFRNSFRKFLEKEAVPYFEEWEEDRLIPRSFWNKMGEQGYLCPWVDEEYGGLGLDFGFSVIITEELSRIGAGTSGFSLHSDIVTPYLANFGNEEQKRKYLPKCVSGEIITAVAMSEPGTGSDLANISTTAVRDGDYYVVNGQKTFISNGIQSDLIILACKTNPKADPPHRGISLLLVDKDTPGFSRGRKLEKLGMRSQDTAELYFEDARIPASNLLGEEGKGFYYLMNKLVQERIIACLKNQVMSEEMLKMTVEYVKERKAFGKPISKFQNTQFVLAEIATEVQLGKTFLDDLISKHMQGMNVDVEVSMAKWWIAETAKKIASKCLQLHGGYGFMEEYKIARFYRDVAVGSISAGSSEVMKMIISKKMGL
jgi:acyl-CoA dehydrogenase